MDRQKTGALIAQMRKDRGLTQRELAEQLHISDRTVSKWERGAGFPDVSMLIPLAEALGLSVLELLQGEQSAPCDSEGAARLALDSVQQVQGWKRQERWRQSICAVLGLGALVLWLAVCGLISLPANRTCLAWVYQDGQQQELTLVHWSGTLQFRLPLRWEFRGQIQTPLAQTTLDPDRELHLALPLTWDKTTSLSHQSWNGNIREQGIRDAHLLAFFSERDSGHRSVTAIVPMTTLSAPASSLRSMSCMRRSPPPLCTLIFL